MESLFLELKKILEDQKETMKQLLNTAREHNRALRQLDMELLNPVLRKEEELTAALNRQDKARKKIVACLTDAAGLPGDATLSRLTGRAPSQLERDIKEIADEIKNIALNLGDINDQNGMLTKQAMRVNEILLNMLTRRDNKTYSPQGRKTGDDLPVSLLDKKV
ncbi:MAG: flagellar protein FlgN [Bacillota bacterium]